MIRVVHLKHGSQDVGGPSAIYVVLIQDNLNSFFFACWIVKSVSNIGHNGDQKADSATLAVRWRALWFTGVTF